MTLPKDVKIPQELFLQLFYYFCDDSPSSSYYRTPEAVDKIKQALWNKADAYSRREAYAKEHLSNRKSEFSKEWINLYEQWTRGNITSEDFFRRSGIKNPVVFENHINQYRDFLKG